MRADLFAAALVVALPAVAAPVPAQRGAIERLSVPSETVRTGAPVEMTVTGVNPCGAVFIDQGDGTEVTHPLTAVPATITHTYSRPGTYQIRARGMGNCDGEAVARIRVTGPPIGTSEGRSDDQRNTTMRFREMDQNGDGVITRAEWRGSAQSFRVHDWNGDGILSGDEVRPGARRSGDPETLDPARAQEFTDWTETAFARLDRNRDGRLSRDEWHYDLESFRRADRNRDGVLTRAEFLGDVNVDDDRDDRFEYLDANRNGRIERSEWHGSQDAFEWLDRNNDGVLSRAEVVGEEAVESDLFASIDANRDGVISRDEWRGSWRSFDRADTNRDGVLSRAEFDPDSTEPGAEAPAGQMVTVESAQRWTDTGISVRAGDSIVIRAEGTVQLSDDPADVAGPGGSRSGRRAQQAPLPQQAAGALIARVGNGNPTLIGDSGTIVRAPAAGRLYLGVNDDHLADNRGEFRVTVTVRPR